MAVRRQRVSSGGIIETKLPGRRRLACHARAGAGAHCGDVRPPGRAYVYFTYGITVPERRTQGRRRSGGRLTAPWQPVEAAISSRRGAPRSPAPSGLRPGKSCQAFGIGPPCKRADLDRPQDGLWTKQPAGPRDSDPNQPAHRHPKRPRTLAQPSRGDLWLRNNDNLLY